MDVKNVDLDKIYTDLKEGFNPGEIHRDSSGRVFQFVKYNSGAGSVTAAAGKCGFFVGTGTTGMIPYETTMDYDSNAAGTAITCPHAVAGIYQAALTDGTYGFVQKTGISRKDITTDGNVAVGNQLSYSTSADGVVIPLADGTPPNEKIGTALAADSGTTLAAGSAMLELPY